MMVELIIGILMLIAIGLLMWICSLYDRIDSMYSQILFGNFSQTEVGMWHLPEKIKIYNLLQRMLYPKLRRNKR